MAEFVGSFASGHAPNIARDHSTMKAESRAFLDNGFAELAVRVKAAAPDVIVVHSTDHWANFFIDNMPAFCIGIGDEHLGPPEPFMKPHFPHETIAGHAGLGRHILDYAYAHDFDPSWSRRLKLDHGICVPLWRMGFDKVPAIVPVFPSLVEPPFPSIKRCLAWGHMIRAAIDSYPGAIRVAVMGTGGLSHSIGETTMGWIDEPFDVACLELFRTAPEAEIAAKIEKMLEVTGNGGAEVRNWAIAHAAAGGKGFDLIGYAPMPDMLIGCGLAEWKLAA